MLAQIRHRISLRNIGICNMNGLHHFSIYLPNELVHDLNRSLLFHIIFYFLNLLPIFTTHSNLNDWMLRQKFTNFVQLNFVIFQIGRVIHCSGRSEIKLYDNIFPLCHIIQLFAKFWLNHRLIKKRFLLAIINISTITIDDIATRKFLKRLACCTRPTRNQKNSNALRLRFFNCLLRFL